MPKCSVLSEVPTRQVEAGSKVIIAPLDFPSSGTDGFGMRLRRGGGWGGGGLILRCKSAEELLESAGALSHAARERKTIRREAKIQRQKSSGGVCLFWSDWSVIVCDLHPPPLQIAHYQIMG